MMNESESEGDDPGAAFSCVAARGCFQKKNQTHHPLEVPSCPPFHFFNNIQILQHKRLPYVRVCLVACQHSGNRL